MSKLKEIVESTIKGAKFEGEERAIEQTYKITHGDFSIEISVDYKESLYAFTFSNAEGQSFCPALLPSFVDFFNKNLKKSNLRGKYAYFESHLTIICGYFVSADLPSKFQELLDWYLEIKNGNSGVMGYITFGFDSKNLKVC